MMKMIVCVVVLMVGVFVVLMLGGCMMVIEIDS